LPELPAAEPDLTPPRRTRVAVVTHAYPPSVGGAEMVHQLVARALQASAQVEVFTSTLNLPALSRGSTGAVRQADDLGVVVHYLPSWRFLGERLIRPWSLWSALGTFRPDVIWTNQPTLSGDLSGLYALRQRIPWVAQYHGDLMPQRPYAALFTWWETRLLSHAKRVMVYGPIYADRLAERGVPSGHIVVAAPGPGIGAGVPPDASGRREFGVPGPDHPFLFVGGLDAARAYKQPERLLKALAQVRSRGIPAAMWIVGDGDRRGDLERLADRLGLGTAVRFWGHLPDPELAERYRDAWALVLPSTESEGFGMVTLEAVTYGCPVVLPTYVAAAPLLSAAGCAVLLRGTSEDELAEQLAHLWVSPELRRPLADAAQRMAPSIGWPQRAPEFTRVILGAARVDARAPRRSMRN
jgi:glycosyltransferase involved in cell wall biosynthesis